MKDFELTLRIRNNRLKSRRKELGLSPRELAERVGISYEIYIAYEGLKTSPLRKNTGTEAPWKASALTLAAFYCCLPEELWPTAILAVRKHEIVAEVEGAKLLAAASSIPEALPSPEDSVFWRERKEALESILAELPPQSVKVLKQHFGFGEYPDGVTLAEAGRIVGRVDGHGPISGGRASQLEAKAMRILKHGKLAKKLRPFYEDSNS